MSFSQSHWQLLDGGFQCGDKFHQNLLSLVEEGFLWPCSISCYSFASVSADLVAEDVLSLRTLTLSGNWIDLPKLARLLRRVPTLEALDLDHTGIVNFPSDLLDSNAGLRRLNLSQVCVEFTHPFILTPFD